MDDFDRDAREQRVKTLKDAEVLESLIAHPGWKVYVELIEKVGQNLHEQIMAPLENVLLVTQTEYQKGTLNGLQAAVRLAHSKIAESKSLRNLSNEEGHDT